MPCIRTCTREHKKEEDEEERESDGKHLSHHAQTLVQKVFGQDKMLIGLFQQPIT